MKKLLTLIPVLLFASSCINGWQYLPTDDDTPPVTTTTVVEEAPAVVEAEPEPDTVKMWWQSQHCIEGTTVGYYCEVLRADYPTTPKQPIIDIGDSEGQYPVTPDDTDPDPDSL